MQWSQWENVRICQLLGPGLYGLYVYCTYALRGAWRWIVRSALSYAALHRPENNIFYG